MRSPKASLSLRCANCAADLTVDELSGVHPSGIGQKLRVELARLTIEASTGRGATLHPLEQPTRRRRLWRAWRTRIVPVWRNARPIIIVFLGLTVMVLGTWGFLDYQKPDDGHFNFWDSLYRAPQLFGFGGSVDGHVPWKLQIARFLGPVAAGYAVIRALFALAGEQIQLLAFRLVLRNHVVVSGLGLAGFRLAKAFDDQGFRVVAIEDDHANSAIAGCRERGIGVIRGDATDARVLRKAVVHRAHLLVVTCGKDGTNVDISTAARTVVARRRRGVLTTLVHVDDLDLWRTMKAQAILSSASSSFRLELFNAFAMGARMLLDRYPPFESRLLHAQVPEDLGAPRPKVLVVGMDGAGPSLVLHIARLWQNRDKLPGETLTITIAGPSAHEELERLVRRHPEIERICQLRARDVELDSLELQDHEGPAATAIYSSLSSETKALAAALALRGRARDEVPIVVAVLDQHAGVASVLGGAGQATRHIEAFGILSETLTPTLLLRDTNELLARAIHDVHVRGQLEKGVTRREDPSLVPSSELPESLKESNRRAADGIGKKLEAVHCVAVPAPLIDPNGPLIVFDEEEVEKLAMMEHKRWSTDLRRDGWRPTHEAKDAAKKIHPLIDVPWDDLAEGDRDKDRQAAQTIPEVLARAGFEISRIQSRTGAHGDERRDEVSITHAR